MKKLLVLILLVCILFIASCGVYEGESSSSSDESSCISSTEPSSEATSSDESSTTESSSQEPTSESSSSSDNSSTDDGAENQPKKEILSGVTPEWFNAYKAYTDKYYHNLGDENTYVTITQVISSYDELNEYVYDSTIKEMKITESLFEDNFIILIAGVWHERTEDVYYNDFKKVNGYYTLTYNLVSWGQEFCDVLYPVADVCVIPKSLCKDDLSTIQVKIVTKEYKFETGEKYNSDCEVITYLPQ